MENFLEDIAAYCDRAGIRTSTFGRLAVNDGKLFSRLQSGGQCLPRTMDRVRAYMAANPPAEAEVPEAGAA